MPLALALARTHGARIVGFDIDARRIGALQAAHDRTGETKANELRAAQDDKRLIVTGDPDLLTSVDVLIVTVPTPVDHASRPDLGPLRAACETIGAALAKRAPERPRPIVVFESTVYPAEAKALYGMTLQDGLPTLRRDAANMMRGRRRASPAVLLVHRGDNGSAAQAGRARG